MSLKRALRFLTLMLFIFIVVALLARSSIWELRAKAEEAFANQRLSWLEAVAAEKHPLDTTPLYHVTRQKEVRPVGETPPLSAKRIEEVLASIPFRHASFRQGDMYWVSLPVKDGAYLLSGATYEEVIAWTKGFEAREIRNAILVIVAFGILALVWMWADLRALVSSQKAQMVEELEKKVLERTEALRRMNRLARLGEFSAGLAHEIRNPLGSLVTASKLLPDARGGERHDLIGVIRRESARLDRLLADFLDFARDPLPKIRMNPLHPILQRTLEGLQRDEAFRQVRITYRLDPEVRDIPCDPEQLEQVFGNIALNGAQAMGGEGEILVSSCRNGRWVEVSFRDTGPGIPADRRERIFEPLYTEKRGGTGLGLSIASRIVEAHKGFIEVASDSRSWTLFTISLPCRIKDDGNKR